jgi:hypothetical protein
MEIQALESGGAMSEGRLAIVGEALGVACELGS